MDEEALARLTASESAEISMSRHIGILQVANGGRRYTSVNPDVQRLTGCEEGTMRGVRLDLWRDDDSAAFLQIYERVQQEGSFITTTLGTR